MPEKLVNAMVTMNEQKALQTASELLESGTDPKKLLGACAEAMEVVGNRFETGEYFLPQLIMAGEILRQITEIIKPKLQQEAIESHLGKVLIGTVKGDIHDIGKDIVVFMLETHGFDVMDLGIDVPPDKFVDAIKEFQPEVVGLSGFLTLAFDSMKETVEAINKANLRDGVKIMIGGGQIDDEIRRHTGADAYGPNAVDAVKLSKKWIGGK